MLLVTGAGGFIGSAIARTLGDMALALGHRSDDWTDRLDSVTVIVHAGRDPRLGKPDYRLEDDAELQIARVAAERGLPFLTLGTRKVYAPAQAPLCEDAPLGPSDRYGEQKLQMEEALQRLLGERLTRLRLANIFGFERGRQSFMGRMLHGLERDDTITFDMSPFVARDFLQVETAAAAIAPTAGGTTRRHRQYRLRRAARDRSPGARRDRGQGRRTAARRKSRRERCVHARRQANARAHSVSRWRDQACCAGPMISAGSSAWPKVPPARPPFDD